LFVENSSFRHPSVSHYVCRAKTTNELRNRYQGRS
jgi:hypothetical protein